MHILTALFGLHGLKIESRKLEVKLLGSLGGVEGKE